MSNIDLLSSPDPIQEIEGSLIPSSARPMTRSITRTHIPQHFYSLASSTASPRKRTFELDVGDERSPQKIRVTVEAGDSSLQRGASSVSRRLFQDEVTPTPRRVIRRKEKATTMSVPLRGLTDDEGDAMSQSATPRRRGRPSKTGTPVASTTRKRPGTPGEKSTRSRKPKAQDDLGSELSAAETQETPRATRRRSPAKRKAPTPAKPDAPPKRRGRPRKAILPDEFQAITDAESGADGGVEDNASVAATDDAASLAPVDDQDYASFGGADYDNYSTAGSLPPAPSDSGAEEGGEDIWMANISDAATPVVARRWSGPEQGDISHISNPTLPGVQPAPELVTSQMPESEIDDAPGDLFMELADADPRSPESHASEPPAPSEHDTVMAGEEFTMISVGSLPSMQPNSSMMAPEPQEMGEATSLIISQTLESLRRSQGQGEGSADLPPTSTQSDAPSGGANEPSETSFLRPAETSMFSQPKSPGVRRSPRRAKSQTPLGRQLAIKSMQSAEKASSPVRSPPKLPTAAPEEAGDTSMFYEDSFSEIPEAVLDAATPKPPRQTYIELEETEEEEELDLIVAPSVERSNSTVNLPSHPQSDSNRLLTPDETPSPDASEHGDEEKKSELDLERELEEVASPARSVPLESLRSSPPVALGPAEQNLSGSVVRHRSHSRNLSLETPVDLAASASSRVSFNALPSQRASLAPPENPNRRTLSPIMRAGRALQMVTSDPPSPPRQGSVLRSPFRGSVRSTESPVLSARRVTKSPTPPAAPSPALASAQPLSSPSIAQQPAQQPESSWARAFAPLSQIKNLVVQGAQAFSSPKAAPAPAPTPAPAPVPVPSSVPTFAAHLADEDPFAPNPDDASRAESLRNSIFGSSRRKSLEAHEPSPSVISSAKAEVASVAGEDDMSWMADDSTPAPRIEMFGQPGSARSSVFATGGSPSGHDDDVDMGADIHEELQSESEVEPEQGEMDAPEESQDELDEEPDQLQDGDENDEELVEMEEEDDDIWAFEAARPTPRSVRTLKVAPPVSAFDKSTRGPPTVARQRHGAGASTEAEEFSMLSQLSRNETAMEREASRLASAKKADLSAFFSSPAPLPDVQPFGLFNALDAKKGENDKPARKIAQPSGLFRGLAGRSAEKRAQVPPASNPFGFSTISGPGSRGPGASPVPRISQTSTLLGSATESSAEPSRPAPRSRRAEPFGVSKRTRTAEVTPAPEAQDSNPPESFGLLGQALGPRSRSGEPAGPSQASRTSELFKASQTAKEGDGLFSQAPAAPQTFGLFMRAEPKAAETDSLPAQRRRAFQPLGRTKPAPFASQPPASLFQEQRAQTEEIRHVPQKDFQIENRRSVELFSPAKQPVRETRQNQPPRSVEHSSAPTTPEQVRFDHVPQKQNFTPRQRQFTSNSLFQPVQASGESSLFAKPAPVVRQSVEQEDDSMVMDPDESSFITPELKPLPDRAASPSKSCIRSPLKGKTPGRVVEFTSSTLSPLQQAQVRAERRASASPEKQQPVLSTVAFAQAPSVRRTSVASSTSEEDKENQTSGSELSSDRETEITQPTKVQLSTTLTSKLSAFGASFSTQPPNVPLSETTWTKAHWVRLDALLQERRTAGGMPFQVKNSALAKPPARRPSRKLLGKQVSAHGETIVLEQWHLDVVDAFRAEVGSWEEDALVKRLFALLVGEERRKKGLVPKVKNGKRVFF